MTLGRPPVKGSLAFVDREIATVPRRCLILLALLTAGLASAGEAVSQGGGVMLAQGNPSCIAQCRAAHSQCRVATRGSPSCDGQLQGCLNSCLRKK